MYGCSYTSDDAPSVPSYFVHMPILWPPLLPLYSLVLPTYSPVLDVAVGGFRVGRVVKPEINCVIEVGIVDGHTISVGRVGGRTSGVCRARGEEGQEDRNFLILHDCW